jgi:hypothetical protein
MSQSGVLGYQSGSGLLFGVVALTAQTGGRFSLLFDGDMYRCASSFLEPLTARAPGEATLLMKKPPPPAQRSLKATPLPSLNSGISELYKQHTPEEMQIRQTITSKEMGGVGNLECLQFLTCLVKILAPTPRSWTYSFSRSARTGQKKRQDAEEMGG